MKSAMALWSCLLDFPALGGISVFILFLLSLYSWEVICGD